MSNRVPRRVVTGHDASGRSVVISDFDDELLGPLPADVRSGLMHDVP